MIGKKAPAFTLQNQDGEKKSLKDYLGQWVIVYFYPRDDTPGCTKEACRFTELKKSFDKADAVILGISPDNEEKHQKFITKYKLKVELLCDPDKKVIEKYGAWGEKNMYGKKTMGLIRSTVLIDPKGKVIEHWKPVKKAAEHPDAVLERLQEALA